MMNYKGYEIEKYSNGEGKFVPNHVIREYYQSEKAMIDRQIKINKNKESFTNTETVEESLNSFFEFFENDYI